MSYDGWKASTPDHEQPYDTPDRPDHQCRRCRATDSEEWHHYLDGVICDACYRVQSQVDAMAENPVWSRR